MIICFVLVAKLRDFDSAFPVAALDEHSTVAHA